jgi:hexosaminidase
MFRLLVFAVLLAGAQPLVRGAAPSLMPLPVQMDARSGKLVIGVDFSVAASGFTDARLDAALGRFGARLARQTGLPMLLAKPASASAATLIVECAAAGPALPTLGEDESYTLDVTESSARLRAPTVTGALRGLETFAQMVVAGATGFEVAGAHVEDRPRFAWRGLMIDSSRHFMPLAMIERNLDAMAAVKLNVLHWHLSDDQGFRVESKRYPRLHEMGSDGRYYTQDELRHIVAYARDRGIRVIPEFDIPAHTQSWFPGYPELASAPGPYTIGRTWGVFEPVMDPTKESTYEFLDAFLTEMAQIFPDPYFHIGGDEVNPKQWNASAPIQAFVRQHKLSDSHGLQAYFNQRILKILEKNRKIMVGWDEILHPDLPKAALIQSWRGAKGLAEAVAAGHRGILSWGYYLDHLNPASQLYGNDPQAGDIAPAQAAMILGGEACIWAEYVNAETVDSRIWPRMAAVAERFWSPRTATDVASMYERMAVVSRLLEWTGVNHRSSYGPMLDRLAGGKPADALRVLADASEGLGLGPRARAQKYTSLVALNRFADAVRPESESVRALQQAAARYVTGKSAENAALLREQFTRWSANDARFQALATESPLLNEVRPLSKDLSSLGATGLKALEYLAAGLRAPADWLAAQNQEITRIQRPQAEVSLAAFRPVKALLDALK